MNGARAHTVVTDDPEEGREIRFLGDVQRLTLAPDDILVLRTPHAIPAETAVRIRDAVLGALGEERRVLVLSDGLELGVLSPTPAS